MESAYSTDLPSIAAAIITWARSVRTRSAAAIACSHSSSDPAVALMSSLSGGASASPLASASVRNAFRVPLPA